jgi:hypothetical protein
MIKNILLSSFLAVLFVAPVLAEDAPFLDKKHRKIIVSRVCKLRASRQYTDREIWSYTRNLIADNANLEPHYQTYPEDELFSEILKNHNEIIDATNSMQITREARSILETSTARCR